MVRVGGMTYAREPGAKMGSRITDMRARQADLEADRKYKVAGWAPVAEGAQGEPIWDLVTGLPCVRRRRSPVRLNLPRLIGVKDNPGMAT